MHVFTTVTAIFALLASIGAGGSTRNDSECILAETKSRLEIASQILETARQNLPNDLNDLCKSSSKCPECKNDSKCPECKKDCECPECKDKIHDAKPADCSDLYLYGQRTDGLYDIWPQNMSYMGPLRVYCDMESNGGGWTVFQRRGNYGSPEDYFYQDWRAYQRGFGDMLKDFWIGNDNLFLLTNQRPYQLRVNLTDWEGDSAYATYDEFWVEDELHKYTLHVIGYNGTAGDSLKEHNGCRFSTKDRNNVYTCAVTQQGAWWYNDCGHSNLNGPYKRGKIENDLKTVSWYTFRYLDYSLKTTVMKIRPANFEANASR